MNNYIAVSCARSVPQLANPSCTGAVCRTNALELVTPLGALPCGPVLGTLSLLSLRPSTLGMSVQVLNYSLTIAIVAWPWC